MNEAEAREISTVSHPPFLPCISAEGMSMDVNVAIVGDEGVGKTSLILSAAQRNFRPGEPVTAQPGTSVKVKLVNADCKCICHDSTSRNMEEVNTIIRKCDVVLLCFSMAGPMSLHSAIYTWLPHISKIDNEIPIVIVGCREDEAIVTEAEITVRPAGQCDCSVLLLASFGTTDIFNEAIRF